MNLQAINDAYAGQNGWVEKNRFVFETASSFGLAIAGSIAISLGKKKSKAPPADLDFVCNSFESAQQFICALQRKLQFGQFHWRVGVNHKNEHCPPGADTHFRFNCALWLPICVMVIPDEKYRFWFAAGGIRVQLFQVVKEAAQAIQIIDHKDRDLSEEDVDPLAFLLPEEKPSPWDEEEQPLKGIQLQFMPEDAKIYE